MGKFKKKTALVEADKSSDLVKYFAVVATMLNENIRLKYEAIHEAYLEKLVARNKLRVAGPYLENHQDTELYIFSVNSQEEAEQLVKNDPYMKYEGIKNYTVTEWNPRFGEFK